MADVTFIIPTIPSRADLLERAIASVKTQTIDCEIIVKQDVDGVGPARLRNEGVQEAKTEWVCFLDDDDEVLPHHAELLLEAALEQEADLVYPWFHHRVNGEESTKDFLFIRKEPAFRHPFDGDWLRLDNYIPVTVLVRRSAFKLVGGFPQPGTKAWPRVNCEDWGCWLRMLDHEMKFVHVPARTWIWHWWSGNTQGMPEMAKKFS